jgi:hypothetical protein
VSPQPTPDTLGFVVVFQGYGDSLPNPRSSISRRKAFYFGRLSLRLRLTRPAFHWSDSTYFASVTTFNSQGIMQSPVVREHAGIPEDQVIMICVAMGWPDDTFPANAVVSQRKSVDDATVFVGFDE